MKKRILIIVLLVVGMAVLFSATTTLAEGITVGDRIFLYKTDENPDFPYPAGEPFHITHGFISYYLINEPIGNGVSLSEMRLYVDGVEIEPDWVDYERAAYPQYEEGWKVIEKLYTYNFPDGLDSGKHTFVRRYFFTCQSYLLDGEVESCDHPAELIEERSMRSTFKIVFE